MKSNKICDQKELEEVAAIPLAKLCHMVEYSPLNEVMETLTKLSKCEELKIKSAFREQTKWGQNIAFYAAGRSAELGGSYKILEFLSKHGIPLDSIDGFSQTALFYAAGRSAELGGSYKILEFL